ncbi:MAG TPA: hypothetical protein PLK30_21240 [Blastocatellia bacterium]|nr:hypothetical protein [Blastocatellia bacterium]
MKKIIGNQIKTAITIFGLILVTAMFSSSVQADNWNKRTVVTFSQPVEVPGGVILPAGTYVFELVDSLADRHIVRIFNKERDHVYATILAIPNWRLNTTDKTVMTFGERAVGSPEAIRSWFYPGANSGEEFVYPKRRAMELAKVTNMPILAMPSELETAIVTTPATVNEKPVEALKEAPITAVKPTGEEVEVAQVIPTPPVQAMPENQVARDDSSNNARSLPSTASTLPLFGLIGFLFLGIGCALWFVPKRFV